MTVQWRGETRDKPSYKNGNFWRQQTWETTPASYYIHTISLNLGKWTGSYPNNDIERINSSYIKDETSHIMRNKSHEVIWKTQPLSQIKNGSMYKDIMASIGLDSPNISTDTTRDEISGNEQGASLANTPIRNNTSSLIALGKHVLIPRQG